MRELDLASVDLNLLVVLQALLAERHVTRAAQRLKMSQPAVSRALARLRKVFEDDILVRVGKRMQPTPRALALLEPLEDVLDNLSNLVAPSTFDPSTAKRRCPDCGLALG